MSEASPATWPICNMAWKIGDILDIEEQFDWTLAAGFDGVGFHACAGAPPWWAGIDPAATGPERRACLRRKLSAFASREIHAPFELVLRSDGLDAAVRKLIPILGFAGDVAATVVTVHFEPPASESEWSSGAWQQALRDVSDIAAKNGVLIGLESNGGFERIAQLGLSNIGSTLDVGHVWPDREALKPYGTLGGLIRRLGKALVNLHVHDHDGRLDHIELGTGRIDFDDVLRGLKDIRYRGSLCLETNPARVGPDGIRRSCAWLRKRIAALHE